MDIMTTLFDQETVFANTLKRVGKEEREEGREEGQLKEIVYCIENGFYSVEQGAKRAGMSVEELQTKVALLYDKKI